jgi:AcrR family transcriptional regulator
MTTTQKKNSRRANERLMRVELILDAAEKLFLDKGFTPTTMNDIGEAAEFGRATLYHYFPSKEAIYVAILERAMDSLIQETGDSIQEADGAPERIKILKDVLLSFTRHRQNFFHLYFITRSEVLPYLDKKLAKRLERKTKEFESIFHDIYRAGVKRGELKHGDPIAMGDIFFAQIIGLMLLNSTEALEPPLTDNVNQATQFFLDNITARPTKSHKAATRRKRT